MVTLKCPTLGEQAYEELQAQIVSGQLPADLAGSLAISPTRLARLELDGLVEGKARRGSMVRRFGLADIEEICRARMWLELHAAEVGIAAGRAGAAFLARLRTIFAEQMRFVEMRRQDARREAIWLDRAFHELIVGLAQNRLIAGWHRTVLRQTQTIRNYSLQHYDVHRTRREHGAIVNALSAGEPLLVLRIHLAASRDEFLSRPAEELPIRR
jgi:DNA-binding GntR family transcriptional regulator